MVAFRAADKDGWYVVSTASLQLQVIVNVGEGSQ